MGSKQNNHNHRNGNRHVFKKRKPNCKHSKNCSTITKNMAHAASSSSAVPMEMEKTSAENHQTPTNKVIKGSRIIIINKLQHLISDVTKHAAKCGSEMKLVSETRERLASFFACSCVKCGHNIK